MYRRYGKAEVYDIGPVAYPGTGVLNTFLYDSGEEEEEAPPEYLVTRVYSGGPLKGVRVTKVHKGDDPPEVGLVYCPREGHSYQITRVAPLAPNPQGRSVNGVRILSSTVVEEHTTGPDAAQGYRETVVNLQGQGVYRVVSRGDDHEVYVRGGGGPRPLRRCGRRDLIIEAVKEMTQ